ncbi:hypothetical protein HMPREF3189_00892 [Clostridiales bacterium KA00134]|nr:hypothetical protein HMPREF3189_00892 [Clostridiales bacterium KA00134]
MEKLIKDENKTFTIDIDNTESLLTKLRQAELDFLIVEGRLEKSEAEISFGYLSMVKKDEYLSSFDVRGITDKHEFSLVFLKGTNCIEKYYSLLEEDTRKSEKNS